MAWELHSTQMTSRERSQNNMSQELITKILSKGSTVINKSPTRNVGSSHEKEACLDYFITNKIDRIVDHQTIYPSIADHALLSITRATKPQKPQRIYKKIRSFKNFQVEKYKEYIFHHPKYLETLYTTDINHITTNLQTIIQNSLDEQAPEKMILISQKNKNQISPKAKELLALRDFSHNQYKITKNLDDLRQMRHYRNQANKQISLDNYSKKSRNLQDKEISEKERWNRVKQQSGQVNFKTPQVIIDGIKHLQSPRDKAEALNRQFITGIRNIINSMEPPTTNPLSHYRDHIGRDDLYFSIHKISMHQLRSIITKLRPTGSSSYDRISMKAIKLARGPLEPLILHLLDQAIEQGQFPRDLKTMKVVPIRKDSKEETSSEGWRPVNIGSPISKIIERVILVQITTHMEVNNLIHPSHHGSIKSKTTQTIINEIHDRILENLSTGQDSALLILDQSKAYDLINHPILLEKLKILGFDNKSLKLIETFLSERTQYVQVEGFDSNKLLVGPQSVAQGSTMSCLLYLIYILDAPTIFHDTPHEPKDLRKCKQPNLKTFVDDNLVQVLQQNHKDLKTAIILAMDKISTYTNANRLQLNSKKTKIMIFSKNTKLKDEFQIQIEDKILRHTPQTKVLGNLLTDNLSWDQHISKIVIPGLAYRLRSLRYTSKYMDKQIQNHLH